MDILDVVNKYKPAHSTFESQFPLLFRDLEKMYSLMKIPIVARTTIRHRYLKLLTAHRNDKKTPNPDYSQKLLQIFHVAICNCFINVRTGNCQCSPENQISDFGLAIYLDQIGPRQFTFECVCANNHLIRVMNGAEELSIIDAVADDSSLSISISVSLLGLSLTSNMHIASEHILFSIS